jgi:uncharacterized protein
MWLDEPPQGRVPLIIDRYSAQESVQYSAQESAHEGAARSSKLTVLIHGLSSLPNAPYLSPFVREGLAQGRDVISLALRGALSQGTDHYHAGFTGDLRALLASELCAAYQEIYVIGCSLGGLVTLRYASDDTQEGVDERVRAVMALCPPLDLTLVQRQLDKPSCALYRRQLLSSLKGAYQRIWRNAEAEGVPLKADLEQVMRSRSIYHWDERVVVPRYGFESVQAYHEATSMTEARLRELKRPSCVVFTRFDPIIPFHKLIERSPVLGEPHSERLHVKLLPSGGHISFPKAVDLGVGAPPSSLASQLSRWAELSC